MSVQDKSGTKKIKKSINKPGLDQDTIQVFLAVRRDGETHEIEFKYHRVKS